MVAKLGEVQVATEDSDCDLQCERSQDSNDPNPPRKSKQVLPWVGIYRCPECSYQAIETPHSFPVSFVLGTPVDWLPSLGLVSQHSNINLNQVKASPGEPSQRHHVKGSEVDETKPSPEEAVPNRRTGACSVAPFRLLLSALTEMAKG